LDVAQHRLDPVEPPGPRSLRMKLGWCAARESNLQPTDQETLTAASTKLLSSRALQEQATTCDENPRASPGTCGHAKERETGPLVPFTSTGTAYPLRGRRGRAHRVPRAPARGTDRDPDRMAWTAPTAPAFSGRLGAVPADPRLYCLRENQDGEQVIDVRRLELTRRTGRWPRFLTPAKALRSEGMPHDQRARCVNRPR